MTGNNMVDKIILALSAGATIGALALIVFTQFFYEKVPYNNKLELEKLFEESRKQAMPEAYKLDKLVVNLQSTSRRLRFLDTIIFLIPFNNESIKLFESSKAIINDLIINTAGAMGPDDLNSVAGKVIFADRVKKGINNGLGGSHVKTILFSHFVVQ
jgi:flagellar protein FliL